MHIPGNIAGGILVAKWIRQGRPQNKITKLMPHYVELRRRDTQWSCFCRPPIMLEMETTCPSCKTRSAQMTGNLIIPSSTVGEGWIRHAQNIEAILLKKASLSKERQLSIDGFWQGELLCHFFFTYLRIHSFIEKLTQCDGNRSQIFWFVYRIAIGKIWASKVEQNLQQSLYCRAYRWYGYVYAGTLLSYTQN